MLRWWHNSKLWFCGGSRSQCPGFREQDHLEMQEARSKSAEMLVIRKLFKTLPPPSLISGQCLWCQRAVVTWAAGVVLTVVVHERRLTPRCRWSSRHLGSEPAIHLSFGQIKGAFLHLTAEMHSNSSVWLALMNMSKIQEHSCHHTSCASTGPSGSAPKSIINSCHKHVDVDQTLLAACMPTK